MHFALLDWVIVIVYLAGSLAAGLYGKRFVTTSRSSSLRDARSGCLSG